MSNNLNIFKNKAVLITGISGFKGSWLSLWLDQLGANVCGLSLGFPSEPCHFKSILSNTQIEDNYIDIRDFNSLNEFLIRKKPDFVFHLAAQALVRHSYTDPIETWKTNTLGTLHLLEALRNLTNPCTAILITSDKCYDNVEWVWGYKETDSLGGPDPYSASKGAAEIAISSYVRSYFPNTGKVRIGIGRAGNVIGGGDWAEDRIIPDCIRAWIRKEAVAIRSPVATRPWQHVLEPLSGYLNLAMNLFEDNKYHGEAFNFGPPMQQNHSVTELIQEMEKHWDIVRWKDVSTEYSGPHESILLKLNCDKAMHNLGWQASWDFERTVKETILWYKNYYIDSKNSITNMSHSQIHSYVKSAQSKGLLWAM